MTHSSTWTYSAPAADGMRREGTCTARRHTTRPAPSSHTYAVEIPDSFAEVKDYLIYGLIAVVVWFSRQAWNLMSASVGSYKEGVAKDIAAIRKEQSSIRSDLGTLEDRVVTMIDEEEVKRRRDVERMEARFSDAVQGIRQDVGNIDRKIDRLYDKLIPGATGPPD